eukprot:CAMPEP_0168520068 /NCGR_PEP_ID=MMETSP0405-20121227/7726_1 /TAXON_ID=498012 /ORGANISM="Trichosphaerium sp, Strain Am-I-7 wt" /LENGTH=417 /DNA_ID=CAMNT_0008540797 /DNA_START=98 /DNA_END=1352 /DNA_ORIENTATION=-
MKRAGHVCSGFPYYNGGAPLRPFRYDDENEQYTCLSTNGSACILWNTRETSPDEFEVGLGNCTNFNSRGYCENWRVDQQEVTNCKRGERATGTTTLITGETTRQECCSTSCDDYGCITICLSRIEREFAICECRKTQDVTATTSVCIEWYCQETGLGINSATEDENYVCLEVAPGGYCSKWEGNIDSYEEFEIATCSCASGSSGSSCSSWSCFERGVHYQRPNLGWIAYGLLVGPTVLWTCYLLLFAYLGSSTNIYLGLAVHSCIIIIMVFTVYYVTVMFSGFIGFLAACIPVMIIHIITDVILSFYGLNTMGRVAYTAWDGLSGVFKGFSMPKKNETNPSAPAGKPLKKIERDVSESSTDSSTHEASSIGDSDSFTDESYDVNEEQELAKKNGNEQALAMANENEEPGIDADSPYA